MLTDCAPGEAASELASAAIGFDGLFPEQVDPLAKECPEDLPCRVVDGDLWFAETPTELEQAKALCEGCPARLACLSGALERGEPWGVWGGEIFERGAIVARKRPRGRPRKNPLVDPGPVLTPAVAVSAAEQNRRQDRDAEEAA